MLSRVVKDRSGIYLHAARALVRLLFPGLAGIVARLELDAIVRGVTVDGMIWPATGFTVMANSDVDGGVPSDLSAGGQWCIRAISEMRSGRGWKLIPPALSGGRPRKTNMRAAMNAILYLLRTGCPWR